MTDVIELKINKMKKTLDELKASNARANAQEELLLKQLEEEFEVGSLEEGIDLLDSLVEELTQLEKTVVEETESLYNAMVKSGLIKG